MDQRHAGEVARLSGSKRFASNGMISNATDGIRLWISHQQLLLEHAGEQHRQPARPCLVQRVKPDHLAHQLEACDLRQEQCRAQIGAFPFES